MDITLTGVLPLIIIFAAIVTAIVSHWILKRYSQAVRKGMRSNIGQKAASSQKPSPGPGSPASPLPLVELSPAALRDNNNAVYKRTKRANRSAALVYFLAGLAYANLLTVVWQLIAGYSQGRFFFLLACYIWPVVLTLWLSTGFSKPQLKILFGGYALVFMLAAIFTMLRNPGQTSVFQLLFLWLYVNGPGTLLLLAFLRRKVRAVGPLVLAFMIVAIIGAFTAVEIVANSNSLLAFIVQLAAPIGLNAYFIFLLILFSGFLVFSFFGYRLLSTLGGKYHLKQFSDQAISIDAIWLLFAVVQPINFTFEGWYWIFSGPIAFAIYKIIANAGFKYLRTGAIKDDGKQLLLLRVFALGNRSAQFFDIFSKWWRRIGNINMISGPDLVTTAIEPHEFLDYISGRLSRQFVTDQADLQHRLATLDRRPDPDGLYRVNEFFCYNDTWRMTMRKLAEESDAVLMDLRGFSPRKRGCIYEIEQLLHLVPLAQIVFLVDKTTDRSFLNQTFQQLWAQTPQNSPNRQVADATVRLISSEPDFDASVQGLLRLLLKSDNSTQYALR